MKRTHTFSVFSGNRFRIAALATCALAVSACVKQMWDINYKPDASLGTTATNAIATADGSVLMTGLVQTTVANVAEGSDSPAKIGKGFIASYSPGGTTNWSTQIGADDSVLGITGIDEALDGSLYVSDIRLGQNVLTHLDNTGKILWERKLAAEPQELTLAVKTVSNDLILMTTWKYAPGESTAGKIYAFDSKGNQLWQYAGVGSDQFDFAVRPTIARLDADTVAMFNQTHGDSGNTAGGITLLDNSGKVKLGVSQQNLGLNAIFDIAEHNGQLAVAGTTEQGWRLLLLDTSLQTVRQQDFPVSGMWLQSNANARFAAQHGTLCFALQGTFASEQGESDKTVVGLLEDNDKHQWSTTLDASIISNAASLTADHNRCAYTTNAPNAPSNAADSHLAHTLVYSVKGIQNTVQLTANDGDLPMGNRTVLRGSELYNALTDVSVSELYDFNQLAHLVKHIVR